ncbi:hypothetical protein JW805_03945 [Roseomonas aeriglobus]|nr:hypothetical protein [Roseomonas aeriglobus]
MEAVIEDVSYTSCPSLLFLSSTVESPAWRMGAPQVRVGGDQVFDDDEVLPVGSGLETFSILAERWKPKDLSDATLRLLDVFGAAAILPMLSRLADTLESVLTTPDAATETTSHRLAGLAGTLGFTALSEAWLVVPPGLAAPVTVRRLSRLAVGTIRRYIAAAERSSTPIALRR